MDQKKIFKSKEGDAWFQRNKTTLDEKNWSKDIVIEYLSKNIEIFRNAKILEIGCSGGHRLNILKNVLNSEVYGIDPSSYAIAQAKKIGLNACIGTADNLEYVNGKFDLVIIGFCLYVCDRSDLFKIASEVDRVLKNKGWVIIIDFYSDYHKLNEYSHHASIKTYKFDYSRLFTWNPGYREYYRKITGHDSRNKHTDNIDDMMSIHVIRKIYE